MTSTFAGLGDALMSLQGLECPRAFLKVQKQREDQENGSQCQGLETKPGLKRGWQGKEGPGPLGRLMAGDRLEGTTTCLLIISDNKNALTHRRLVSIGY